MKYSIVLLSIMFLVVFTEAQTTWKIGDRVQVKTSAMEKWENATILRDGGDGSYKATLDDPANYADATPLVYPNQIRSVNAKPATIFAINSRVDVYLSYGDPKGRATVLEIIDSGRYKVRYDGCKAYWDEVVDWSQLKPVTYISSDDPDLTATFGKWAMFVYSYPNTVLKGNDIYREYGPGGKAPPLLINANGTFVWYDEFKKPPVNGKWTAHAKIEGLKMGTESVNGILIYDSRGNYWKVYKDRADHIEARLMCSGETQGGTRIR